MSKSFGFGLLKKACACFALSAFLFAGCSSGDESSSAAPEKANGDGGKAVTAVTVSANPTTMDSATGTSTITAKITGNDSATVAWSITSGSEYATLSSTSTNASGGTASVTLTGKNTTTSEQSVTVTATAGSKQGTVTVKVPGKTTTNTPSTNVISASDTPTGYAASGYTAVTSRAIMVSTREDLISAVKTGGLIYINGMIDMTDGDYGTMLPSSAGGTTTGLDSFVNAKASAYSTYTAFKTAYTAACSAATNDKSSSPSSQSGESTLRTTLWTLNKAYQGIVCLNLKSNTTIVGLTENSGIKGGSIQISGESNVTLRNLIIQDAYDPFPHHEKNDGFNAELDGICIQGTTSNIWIDHCTIKDTMHCSTVTTNDGTEKWQTYDGLCDIKGSADSVTVSYCRFEGHDKTMLIGSDDTESFTGTRQVTLHHNYFLNCGQRLPMVRMTNIHIYNNVYDTDSNKYYDQQYAIGVRSEAHIVAENNYFGSGIKYAFNGSSKTADVGSSHENKVSSTLLYKAGNSVNCTELGNKNYYTVTSTKPFTPSYTYELETASKELSSNAGAGVWSVKQ